MSRSHVPFALVPAALLTLAVAFGASAQSPSAAPQAPAASCAPADASSPAPGPVTSGAPTAPDAPSAAPAASMAPAPSGAVGPASCVGTPVSASLTEMSITLDVATVPAGEVTFDAINVGTVEHELLVIASDLPQDQLPVKDGVVDEGAVNVLAAVRGVQPGTDAHLSVDLPAGHYVLICNLPGHYLAGMHAELTVE